MARTPAVLPFLLLLAWSSFASATSGSPAPSPTKPPPPFHCRSKVISYFSAFPCTREDFAEVDSESEALQILRSCDVFAYVGAELAVRHINEHRQGILEHLNFTVSQFTGRGTQSDLAYATFQFAQALRDVDKHTIHGVIGPQDSEVAIVSLANIATRYQTTQITYGAVSPRLSDRTRFPYLHSTTPTTTLLNLGRLRILQEFNWRRCALLASAGFPHTESLYDLINSAKERADEYFTTNLRFYGTFDTTAVHVLDEYVNENIRIFILISDEIRTRNTLCEAHHHRKVRLTGPAYVWIIPSFYDPYWWQLSDNQISQLPSGQQCSNYEIEEIFNTTHVLSAALYNYQLQSVDDWTTQAINITHESFLKMVQNLTLHYLPSLSHTNLLSHLLHSHSASAYDAVWAMTRAWEHAIPPLIKTYNICSIDNQTEVQDISGTVLNKTLNGTFLWRNHTRSYKPSFFQGVSGRHDFSKDVNTFGKVLVSQYIDGKERPIGIYPANRTSNSQIKLDDLQYIVTSDEEWLFEEPRDFLWLAGSVPSDGINMEYSEIPTAGIVVVVIAVVLSIVFAAGLGIASLIFRNNKHIKASSHRLSYLVIVGLLLVIPSSLKLALVNSSGVNPPVSTDTLSAICKAGFFSSSTGKTFAFGVLLVKNWRIYRIFYNSPFKKENLRYLSDKYLLLASVLLLVPHLIILTLRISINPLRYTEAVYTISPTSSLTITHCSSENLIAWDFISISYFGALAFLLLFLSLQTTRVPDHFKQEGNQTSIAVLITLLVFTPCLMLAPCLDADPRLYVHKFWLTALVTILLPDILLGTLFLNKLLVIWREWRQKTSLERKRNEREKRRARLANLSLRASQLQLELTEKEKKVHDRRLQLRQLSERSNSSATSTTELLPTLTPSTTSTDNSMVLSNVFTSNP